MKRKIYWTVDKNRGSCQDPSCVFKIVTAAFSIFLVVGVVNFFGDKDAFASLSSTESNENLFLTSVFIPQEPSEIIVSHQNTIYSSSPLHVPGKIQVFGVQAEENPCSREIISYKVKEGDNLSIIADSFRISIDTIISANDIGGKKIKPGQDLVILPVSGIFHITQQGDTVSSVASKYKSEESDIISCNGIEGGKLYAGDILIVPGGKIPKPAVSSSPRQPSPSSSTISSSWLIPPASGHISQRLHWHNAVDIANNCGTPIYAAASGTVQQTGYHRTAGSYIRIQHTNGIVTFYGHLSRIIISGGQSVTQGSVIGYMGNTGYTIGPTGCHLHFEVRGGTNPFARYPLNHRF